jgi:hypothetical protein
VVSRSAVRAATRVRFLESTLESHPGLAPIFEICGPRGLPRELNFKNMPQVGCCNAELSLACRNMFSGISDAVNIAFRDTIRGIPEPRSISETARVWDSCVRQAVVEFAQQFGGGAFSSRYGRWERLGGA